MVLILFSIDWFYKKFFSNNLIESFSISQAGGCCHTYVEKGYEFDVGIHYIGEMHYQSLSKTLLDQISDGQIQWEYLSK